MMFVIRSEVGEIGGLSEEFGAQATNFEVFTSTAMMMFERLKLLIYVHCLQPRLRLKAAFTTGAP